MLQIYYIDAFYPRSCSRCNDFNLFMYTGYYAYIETSSPRRPNDNAKLEFTPSLGSGGTCISFNYHMLGRDVGTLKVSVNGKTVFTKSGTQGSRWNKADLKVQERATTVSTVFFLYLYYSPII